MPGGRWGSQTVPKVVAEAIAAIQLVSYTDADKCPDDGSQYLMVPNYPMHLAEADCDLEEKARVKAARPEARQLFRSPSQSPGPLQTRSPQVGAVSPPVCDPKCSSMSRDPLFREAMRLIQTDPVLAAEKLAACQRKLDVEERRLAQEVKLRESLTAKLQNYEKTPKVQLFSSAIFSPHYVPIKFRHSPHYLCPYMLFITGVKC